MSVNAHRERCRFTINLLEMKKHGTENDDCLKFRLEAVPLDNVLSGASTTSSCFIKDSRDIHRALSERYDVTGSQPKRGP